LKELRDIESQGESSLAGTEVILRRWEDTPVPREEFPAALRFHGGSLGGKVHNK